jgi:hypothetical protein
MRTRNQAAAAVVALACLAMLTPAGPSFADTPEKTQKPADAPPAPPQKVQGHGHDRDGAPSKSGTQTQPPKDSAAAKQGKADPSAARKVAQARIARCRLHPEICVQ